MSGSGKFKAGEGDWICADPKCGNVNFSRRGQCNKCGKTEKSEGQDLKKGGAEIGKAMAEKSKGLFSADDWQCKTCGNVNWARRMQCNMCNTPKFGKLEARTGYGGGYMERDEVVEYKEKPASDDEFDEFGRKKKKFRGHTSEPGTVIVETKPIIPQVPEDDDDEDDEEEEEEGGDMSKYQLDSDDEEDDEDVDLSKYALDEDDDDLPKIKVIVKKPENRGSGSRSSSSSSSSSSSDSSRSSSRSGDRHGYGRNNRKSGSYSRSRSRSRSRERDRRQQKNERRSRSRSRDRAAHSRHHTKSRSDSRSRSRSRSRDRRRHSLKYRRRSRSRS